VTAARTSALPRPVPMELLALLEVCTIARQRRGGQPIRAGHCVWCAAPLTGRRRRWCGDGCVRAHQTNHLWSVAREAALTRDGHRCVRCGYQPTSTEEPWRQLGETPAVFAARLRRWREANPQLEVNHITPCLGGHAVAGCHHHQENLESLCRPCHVGETARQFGYAAARAVPPDPDQGVLW